MKISNYFIGTLLLTFLVGYTFGQTVMSRKIQDVPLTITTDTRQKVPVVIINGIENSKLVGSIAEEVRVFLDDEMVIPNASGAFAVSADSLFVNSVTVSVPEGMQFVASSRGKYYYPVISSKGERITPKNRIYFRDANAAEGAGFVRGK